MQRTAKQYLKSIFFGVKLEKHCHVLKVKARLNISNKLKHKLAKLIILH